MAREPTEIIVGPPPRHGALAEVLASWDGALPKLEDLMQPPLVPVKGHGPQRTQTPASQEVDGARGSVQFNRLSASHESYDFPHARVDATLKARIKAVQFCYEARLRRNPSSAGNVKVEFVVEPRGHVLRALVIEDTTADAQIAECVVNVARRLRFNPGPERSVRYVYGFSLAPS